MLGRQIFLWITVGVLGVSCGGFPDIRNPEPAIVKQISLLNKVEGYWISSPNDRALFKNTARKLKTAFLFSEKNKYGELEYKNLFLIEKSGQILLLQAKSEPQDGYEIIEDEMGLINLNESVEPKLQLNEKYLNSDLGKAKSLSMSIEKNGKRMYIVTDGFVHAFYRTSQRKAIGLLRSPSFDFNPWEIFR